jgi:hypothetical protein
LQSWNDGEQIEVGFQLIRDMFMFTDKRLIVVNVQGLSRSFEEKEKITLRGSKTYYFLSDEI